MAEHAIPPLRNPEPLPPPKRPGSWRKVFLIVILLVIAALVWIIGWAYGAWGGANKPNPGAVHTPATSLNTPRATHSA